MHIFCIVFLEISVAWLSCHSDLTAERTRLFNLIPISAQDGGQKDSYSIHFIYLMHPLTQAGDASELEDECRVVFDYRGCLGHERICS